MKPPATLLIITWENPNSHLSAVECASRVRGGGCSRHNQASMPISYCSVGQPQHGCRLLLSAGATVRNHSLTEFWWGTHSRHQLHVLRGVNSSPPVTSLQHLTVILPGKPPHPATQPNNHLALLSVLSQHEIKIGCFQPLSQGCGMSSTPEVCRSPSCKHGVPDGTPRCLFMYYIYVTPFFHRGIQSTVDSGSTFLFTEAGSHPHPLNNLYGWLS